MAREDFDQIKAGKWGFFCFFFFFFEYFLHEIIPYYLRNDSFVEFQGNNVAEKFLRPANHGVAIQLVTPFHGQVFFWEGSDWMGSHHAPNRDVRIARVDIVTFWNFNFKRKTNLQCEE